MIHSAIGRWSDVEVLAELPVPAPPEVPIVARLRFAARLVHRALPEVLALLRTGHDKANRSKSGIARLTALRDEQGIVDEPLRQNLSLGASQEHRLHHSDH